jgi:hypothetical protein
VIHRWLREFDRQSGHGDVRSPNAVYYRNAWIFSKFAPTQCTLLKASGAQGFEVENGITLPWPFDQPFLNLAALNPRFPAEWDGWKHFGCE